MFEEQIPFNTGTRRTGWLYQLLIANVTYVPLSSAPRRFEELYYYSLTTQQVRRAGACVLARVCACMGVCVRRTRFGVVWA